MSEGAGQRASGGSGFDPKTLEDSAKALVAGHWQGAVAGLVSAAATAAAGNPFAGIVAGGAANWLWAKVAARSATERLKAAATPELAALKQAQQQARMKEAALEALQQVRPQDATETELAQAQALAAELGEQAEPRPQDLRSIAGTLEEGLGHLLRGQADLKEDHEELKADHAELMLGIQKIRDVVVPQARDDAGLLTTYRDSLRIAHNRPPGLFVTEISELDTIFVELELQRDDTRLDRSELDQAKTTGLTLQELMKRPVRKGAEAVRWVVLGDPGAGKSTLARHLVWSLSDDPSKPLPVYAPLPALAAKECHPFELAEAQLKPASGTHTGKGLARLLFERAEGPDPVWLFLDGLDEVAPDHRAWVHAQLSQWAQQLPKVTIAVLSRPVGFTQPGPAYSRHARIQALSEVKQRQLLTRWLDADRAQALLKVVKDSPGLREVCRVPLILSLLAYLDRTAEPGQGAVARNKLELFRRSLGTLLERGHSEDKRGVKNPSYAREILGHLSCALQAKEGESWSLPELDKILRRLKRADEDLADLLASWKDGTAFLRDVADRSGVLAPHAGESAPWGFLHRQFRELLTAEALRASAGDAGVLDKAKALTFEEVPRWAEVLGFACELAAAPFELFEALADVNEALALRLLPELERINCVQALGVIAKEEGWDGDYLLQLLQRWVEQGSLDREAATAWLWRQVDPERSTKELAYFHYALEHLVGEVDRRRFFDACGRPWPSEGGALPDLVPIRGGGKFLVAPPEDAADPYGDEGPQHEVTVSAFELSATAVTNAQYEAFDSAHDRELFDGGLTADEAADHPVVNVSFWEAYLYCCWAGGRLPTEAQWEYACRAGTTTPFSCGDNITTYQVNYDGGIPYADGAKGDYRGKTVAVGSLPANPWGMHEMHGNIFEWCADWYGKYPDAPQTDPCGPERGEGRIVRGGSWYDEGRCARSAYRRAYWPAICFAYLGFRLSRGQNQPGPKTAEPSEASERSSPGRRRGGTPRSGRGNA